mmetsp:Transcript_35513/g.114167  ORF Transcript_35513/g.114167 Transcript_35513/m.114167 type:complete len:222 (+) Transcript_35513:64-729(+)
MRRKKSSVAPYTQPQTPPRPPTLCALQVYPPHGSMGDACFAFFCGRRREVPPDSSPPAPGARIGADGTAPASNTSIAPISCARSTCSRASPSQVARSRTKSSSMAADWPKTGAYMSSSRFATPISTCACGGRVMFRTRKPTSGCSVCWSRPCSAMRRPFRWTSSSMTPTTTSAAPLSSAASSASWYRNPLSALSNPDSFGGAPLPATTSPACGACVRPRRK